MENKSFYYDLVKDLDKQALEIVNISKENTFLKQEIELKDIINNLFDKLHREVDESSKEFLAEALLNLPEDKLKDKIETENSESSTQDKIKTLMSNLEAMIEVATVNEEIIEAISSKPLEKLIIINKDNTVKFRSFKVGKNILYGKQFNEFSWNEVLAERNNRAIVDENTLKLKSESCWNFFATNEKFTEGIVKFTVEVNIDSSDDHFYIGVVNEKKKLTENNGCFCCNNPNSYYINKNGTISTHNNLSSETITVKTEKKKFNIMVELDIDNKKVKFYRDDAISREHTVQGKEFTFLAACCNSTVATVTILDYDLN